MGFDPGHHCVQAVQPPITVAAMGGKPEQTFDAIKQIDRHGGYGLLQE
ncbi:hypothetical protein [Ilumatobacter sp.]